MESVEFINRYEIWEVVKPELIPILEELKQIDPHDLVRPEWYNQSLTIYFVGDFFLLPMILPKVVEFESI